MKVELSVEELQQVAWKTQSWQMPHWSMQNTDGLITKGIKPAVDPQELR
jgi:hypothetical protein